jgi:hypothetical protein
MKPLILCQIFIVLINNEGGGNQVSTHWCTNKSSVELGFKIDSQKLILGLISEDLEKESCLIDNVRGLKPKLYCPCIEGL